MTESPFLKNRWYTAAMASEVDRQPLARTICNEPIVFYRRENGTPVAIEDRCCHRRMPLSRGTVMGDNLRCHYHGLTFNPSGDCVYVPGQTTVPPGARVKGYPVVERHTFIWIWLGDPALADPATIPDYRWFDAPGWGAKSTRFHVRGDYRLIIDNLMDLSHLAYVHQSTIGNYAVAENANTRVFRHADGVTVVRWIVDQAPPPTYARAGGFTGNVDRWQIIDWKPPGYVRLFTGAAPGAAAGQPFGFTELETDTPTGGIGLRNLNLITPESETTTHYFWGQAHDVKPVTAERTEAIFQEIYKAFMQDWEVFELQQTTIDRDPASPTVDINADAGPIACRQLLERLVADENRTTRRAVAAE
ncbi:MAG: aromatic ring-hydroxylating dioxygenase subunit alpha [Alphaproteobacteria bacterium]|nr:aromatic ring-hydroxylating dioxygenase subunit alpha [Alphaproteobacteria bacterium]